MIIVPGISIPRMFFVVLMMCMFMPNLLVLLMNMFIGLFGFLRPLLLTKGDPLKNGFPSGGASWIIGSGATNHMTGSMQGFGC